jgi:hypothetical protein
MLPGRVGNMAHDVYLVILALVKQVLLELVEACLM